MIHFHFSQSVTHSPCEVEVSACKAEIGIRRATSHGFILENWEKSKVDYSPFFGTNLTLASNMIASKFVSDFNVEVNIFCAL